MISRELCLFPVRCNSIHGNIVWCSICNFLWSTLQQKRIIVALNVSQSFASFNFLLSSYHSSNGICVRNIIDWVTFVQWEANWTFVVGKNWQISDIPHHFFKRPSKKKNLRSIICDLQLFLYFGSHANTFDNFFRNNKNFIDIPKQKFNQKVLKTFFKVPFSK